MSENLVSSKLDVTPYHMGDVPCSERNVPFSTISEQVLSIGWEAGLSRLGCLPTVTLNDLCPLKCQATLNLCLRINYEIIPEEKEDDSGEKKDYVTGYDSKYDSIKSEIEAAVHQGVDKLVSDSVEGQPVSAISYEYGLHATVYVAEYVKEDSGEIRVFYHHDDAIKWRDEIVDKRWGERFTDNPPVGKNVADEYFDRLAFVGDYSEVFTVTSSVLEI